MVNHNNSSGRSGSGSGGGSGTSGGGSGSKGGGGGSRICFHVLIKVEMELNHDSFKTGKKTYSNNNNT